MTLTDFISDAIAEHGHKPTEWQHDRSAFVSASTVGTCARKQKRAMTDPEQPQDRWGFLERGHNVEAWLVDVLKRAEIAGEGGELAGLTFHKVGDDQETLIDDDLKISATPDGFLTYWNEHVYLEIKSIDPRVSLDGPKETHKTQVQFGMELAHRCSDFAPERAIIIYVDASDYQNISVFEIQRDPVEAQALIDRAAMIHAAGEWTDLAAEGADLGGFECRTCPYASECAEARIAAVETAGDGEYLDSDTRDQLEALADEWSDWDSRKKAAADMADKLSGRIRVMLGEHDVSHAETDRYSVKLSTIKGRVTYDTKAMIADGHDLSDYEKVGNGSVRLNIRTRV